MFGTIIEILQVLFGIAFFGVIALGTIFWIWMLIDCATKEPAQGNDKLVWVIIILLTHFIGATIYFFVRRPRRLAESGG